MDAMHWQVETAQAIVDRDATCIITVKGNQPTLFEALRKHVMVERSHGRNERANTMS